MLPATGGEFLLMSSGHQNGVNSSTLGDVIIKNCRSYKASTADGKPGS
jgi:hypothetical protein